MLVSVGDVRLFVDVDGAKLVPDGMSMRERPTIVCGQIGSRYAEQVKLQRMFSVKPTLQKTRGCTHLGKNSPERASWRPCCKVTARLTALVR